MFAKATWREVLRTQDCQLLLFVSQAVTTQRRGGTGGQAQRRGPVESRPCAKAASGSRDLST